MVVKVSMERVWNGLVLKEGLIWVQLYTINMFIFSTATSRSN